MKAITNAKIIHNKRILKGYNLIFDEKIISLSKEKLPVECKVIDARECYVSAGFVDMHIHGNSGADVMDGTLEALETISSGLISTGTTTFVATTMTMSQKEITKALDNIIKNQKKLNGAKLNGIHLEGPFINPNKCGAQDSTHIQTPNSKWLKPYLPYIRVITLAPEMSNAQNFISYIKQIYPHIVLSIGHSEATYAEALESFSWGVSHATHLFNAMPPWHHRKPGIIGAVVDSNITTDIIADCIHTHPSMLSTIERLKKDRVILITDAMRAGCMKNGEYDLGGQSVIVSDGKATLANGVLAGSLLTLNKAIKNYHKHTQATLAEVIYATTTLPAHKLGLDTGVLSRGKCADIVLFDDNIEIQAVYIDGVLKYQKS